MRSCRVYENNFHGKRWAGVCFWRTYQQPEFSGGCPFQNKHNVSGIQSAWYQEALPLERRFSDLQEEEVYLDSCLLTIHFNIAYIGRYSVRSKAIRAHDVFLDIYYAHADERYAVVFLER